MPKQRVTCYIDGFNFYHALRGLGKNHLKWLDLRKLAGHFIMPSVDELDTVYYFTAHATWIPGSFQRQLAFLKALEAHGVTVVLGNFKEVGRSCPSCRVEWLSHEEKRTDVQIGIHLVRDAAKDRYDKAILISADSDLEPAVLMAKKLSPAKPVELVTPPGRRNMARALCNASDRVSKIKLIHLESSLLPERFSFLGTQIVRPVEYDPPLVATI